MERRREIFSHARARADRAGGLPARAARDAAKKMQDRAEGDKGGGDDEMIFAAGLGAGR